MSETPEPVSLHDADPVAAQEDAAVARARNQLGGMVRRLVDLVARADIGSEDMAATTAALQAVLARLEPLPQRRRGHDNPFHPMSLVGGTAHPVAPQLRLEPTTLADGLPGVRASVALGVAFEGGPGLAHGGVLALLFDHAMGAAVYLDGHAAMTRTLDVHYHAPTVLDAELDVTAWVQRVEGRRVHVRSEIRHGETVTASADAVFIRLTADNVASIFARRRPTGDEPAPA